MDIVSVFLFFTVCSVAAAQKCPPNGKHAKVCQDVQKISKSLNQFTLEFYKSVTASAAPATNLIMQPASAAPALLLACSMATGATRTEIEQALHVPAGMTCADFAEIRLGLWKRLTETYKEESSDRRELQDVVNYVNRAYVDKSIKVKPQFSQVVAAKFNQTLGIVDFQGNAEGARAEINKWVSDQSSGTIQDLAQPGSISSTTQIFIINAMNILFLWAVPFDPAANTKNQFTNSDGSVSQVAFMNSKGRTRKYLDSTSEKLFAGVPAFQMLILADRHGHRATMIFLPKDANTLPALEKALTVDMINQAADNAKRTKVDVALPKFNVEWSTGFAEPMAKLGVKKVFSKDAELGELTDSKVKVDSLMHKASIVVQENGAEAAAASDPSSTQEDTVSTKSVIFEANRPFLIVRRMEPFDILAMIGRVTKL